MSSFQDLPLELILKILSYSEIKALITCGQVSKRIRKISHDNSLWMTVSLEKKTVRPELLEIILERGCRVLKISNSTIHGSLSSNIKSQLRVLDLSQSTSTWPGTPYRAYSGQNIGVLEQLLLSCCFLQRLAIDGLQLTPRMRDGISKNCKTLEILNLSGLDIKDDHVKILLSRCNKIKALSLKAVWISDISLTYIRHYLNHTLEELSLTANKIISETGILELKSMPRLRSLKLLYKEDWTEAQKRGLDMICQHLRQYLPHLTITTSFINSL